MVSEFELINNIKTKFGLCRVGDDCAVLPKDEISDLIVTADMLVENVDFRLDWTTPEFLGHKALAVSLSDIAAMGGKPIWAMVSIAVPEERWRADLVERFYDGWHALAEKFRVELVGGDISISHGGLVIDSIVGGDVPRGKAVLRSGAKAGDLIYVSGSLGGSSGGLQLLEARNFESQTPDDLLERQLKPMPQLILAKLLQNNMLASSMIDISDGLSSDLAHLCSASGTGARIFAQSIPQDPDLARYFDPDRSLDMALNGGEDFELLFTSREKNILLPGAPQISLIGEMTSNVGIIELITNDQSSILPSKGYRHF